MQVMEVFGVDWPDWARIGLRPSPYDLILPDMAQNVPIIMDNGTGYSKIGYGRPESQECVAEIASLDSQGTRNPPCTSV